MEPTSPADPVGPDAAEVRAELYEVIGFLVPFVLGVIGLLSGWLT